MYKVIKTWDGYTVIEENLEIDAVFAGSLADCYAFIQLKKENLL